MKSRLNVLRLEDRDCPAAGSSLTQIAVGPDFTLSINSYGRFASMQMSGPDWVDWMDTNQSLAQVQAMTKRIYQYFPDQFDNIFFVNNLPDLSPNAQYYGANYTPTIKNETQGIGRPLFDNTAAWGSAGKLQNVIHLASMQDLYYRTTLHEMIHRDAAFLSQLGGPSYGGHWGFSSVGGQLGGWVPGTLRQIGANTYDADGPTGTDWYTNQAAVADGNVPLAPLELYLMGLADISEVPDVLWASNGNMTNQALGQFTADSIQLLTTQNIIAQEGPRVPSYANSQRNFRTLTVVLSPLKLTQAEIDYYDTAVELFGRPGDDGNPAVLNFWEATSGRGQLSMEGLNAFIPANVPPAPTASPNLGFLGISSDNQRVFGFNPNAAGVYDVSRPVVPNFSLALDGFTGEVRTAVGDVNGDTIPDFAVVTGPGTPTRFAVTSGSQNGGNLMGPSFPFAGSEDFAGGGFVSVGDLTGDGRAEVVITADQGGGPRVVVYSFDAVKGPQKIADFFGIADPNFRGGARTAVGDVNGDGRGDLAVAAGFGGGPRVALYSGATLLTTRAKLVNDFFAFGGTDALQLRNGVYLAMGDINGDNADDLVFGGGPGGAPRVYALSGSKITSSGVTAAQAAPLANFFVANDAFDRGGVRVAVKNADKDKFREIVAGSGQDSRSRIRVYRGSSVTPAGEPRVFQEIDPFGVADLPSGVYVG